MNVKEDLKEYNLDIPKNNKPKHVNNFSTDHIDAADRNIIIDKNNSNPNNIPESLPDNSQLIDLMATEYIAHNNTSSNNNNNALSNTTSTEIDDMLAQVRKINVNNIFPTYQRDTQIYHQ